MWQAWELKLGYCLVYNSKPFFPVKCLWFCQSFLILNSSLASVSSLGAIPILRLYIFGIFGPTHLPYQHRYNTERQEKWPYSRPTHPDLLLTLYRDGLLYRHCKVKIVRWCYEFLRLSKSGSSECWVSGSDLQNKTVFFCLNGNLLKSIQNDLDKIFINIFKNIKSVPDK